MMRSSDQVPEELTTIKKRATLDSIPEDVALAIVERVKGWALEGKTLGEKEKATKARDSTLRALVLSCRKNFRFYFPALLENVTINGTHLISIQGLLQRENHGDLVKLLHVKPLPADFSDTAKSLLFDDFAAISSLLSSTDYDVRFQEGVKMVLTGIFRNVSSIETLIIEPSTYICGLFFEPHTFLTKSLKNLYISSDKTSRNNLSARNSLWLLLFVPSLQQVALGLAYSIEDFKFLLEFGDTIEGLSQVSKLSLQVQFGWNVADRKTWWGLEKHPQRHSAQGNQKTFAVSQLLRCVNTNHLVSLEIAGNGADRRKGDNTLLYAECLTVLHQSFNSLLHLRLFGLAIAREGGPSSTYLSNFKNVKMLTLDGSTMYGVHVGGQKIAVPSSLEVIWTTDYGDEEFSAEDHLLQFVKSRSSSLPKLREMVVPMAPVFHGKLAVNVEKENWTRKRERLEKEEIFTSGRVILKKVEEGEIVGDPSKPGEVFLSTLRWIAS